MAGHTTDDDLVGVLRRTERALERYRHAFGVVAATLGTVEADAASWRSRYRALESSLAVRAAVRVRWCLDRAAPPASLRRAAVARVAHASAAMASGAPADRDPLGVPGVPVVPMALQPAVTIVVPVHDQWARTAACLRAVATEPTAVGFEVVVVDDASSDETAASLREVVGIHAVRLEANRGFLGAVGAGLEIARGRYVVLLNNDTVVQPGWLDALVDTAESDPAIGVVGAKLVYPDGRLQEAGGIVFDDGSGHNYGRDQDPSDPRFAFVRDVDYCSGACLLVRRELLTTLGGLDARFAPAYYEDTDLCFAARRHGHRVVYQPAAVVVHDEGASHGTDTATGVKRYQEVNRHKFAEKWADVLPSHGPPDMVRVRASSWRAPAGRCLVIDHALPMPDVDSGSRRMSELLGLLGDLGFGVTFVPNNGVDLPAYRGRLAARGIEVLRGPADLDDYMKGVGRELRLIVLSRPTVAWANYPMMRSLAPHAHLVYDTVDLHYVREERRAATEPGTVSAIQSADYHFGMETSLAQLVDQVWTVSDVEAAALRKLDPSLDVAVVPNIHRSQSPGPPLRGREGLLFVGNYSHDPNRDAAKWLVEEIAGKVRASLGDVPVVLAGSCATPEIESLAGDGVVVTGWVPDLEDLYHHSRLFVAPLRYGAGMKGKIGEACAYGLPVVTTSIGVEGMGLVDGKDVLVRDDAAGFAAAVVEAYGDAELWQRLSACGRRTIQRRFSPDHVREQLADIVTGLGLDVRPR